MGKSRARDRQSSSSSSLNLLASLAFQETENEKTTQMIHDRTTRDSFILVKKFKKNKTMTTIITNKVAASAQAINKKKPVPSIQTDDASYSQKRDWTALPNNVVCSIANQLPVLSAVSMAAACNSWSCVITEPVPTTRKRGFPWLMLCGQNDSKVRTCLSVLEDRVRKLDIPEALGRYCWGSIQDWLLLVEVLQHGELSMFFLNPFSRIKLHLPKVADAYFKMVLSASPINANCVFVLLCSFGTGFVCWTPGVNIWRQRHMGFNAFDDAVFCNGCFYFVRSDYSIHIIDADSMVSAMKEDLHAKRFRQLPINLRLYQVAIPERSPQSYERRYLVESCGEVLLVCRLFDDHDGKISNTHSFEVFKLDTCKMAWVKLKSLGDRVLFIGKTDSRSFSAKELGIDVADCIFFLNDLMCNLPQTTEWEYHRKSSTFDGWGVFSLGSHSFIPDSCYRMDSALLSPIWITAPIWWYLSRYNPQLHRDGNDIVAF